MTKPNAKRFVLLKLIVSISLIGYLISIVDLTSITKLFASLNVNYLWFAVCLLLCQSILSTLKWKALLTADGITEKFRFLLKTYLIGNFFSLFLPTSFGGDVYRVLALRRTGAETTKITSSVLFDRLTGLFALISISAISYMGLVRGTYSWLVLLGYTTVLAVFWIGVSGYLVPEERPHSSRWRSRVIQVFKSFHTYGRKRRTLALALFISLTFQLNVVLINKFYSLAVGIDVPFYQLMVIIPLIYLTEAIPVSINGIGVRESAFVFFYVWIGQSAEVGFTISLLVVFFRYAMGMVGGILYLVSTTHDSKTIDTSTR